MLTAPSLMTDNTHSEYPLKTWSPLQPQFDLHSDTEALWVEGIGHIAQYHCYCEMLYSHGVIYFIRDWLFREIEDKIEMGVPPRALRTLIRRLNTLNSKIRVHESMPVTAIVSSRWAEDDSEDGFVSARRTARPQTLYERWAVEPIISSNPYEGLDPTPLQRQLAFGDDAPSAASVSEVAVPLREEAPPAPPPTEEAEPPPLPTPPAPKRKKTQASRPAKAPKPSGP